MVHQPNVSFITVNYNQTEMTVALIASIYKYAAVPFEIIVVDNHSNISPKNEINRIYPDVKVIVSGVNRGFAGGNNLGVEASKGSFLFFINNDAVLTEGAVQTMLASFEKPEIGVVSPLICYYPTSEEDNKDVIQYAGATNVHPFTGRNTIIGERTFNQSQYCQSKPTFYAHGAAMLVKREVLEKVGMMSERYFLYYEELDWSERIRKNGYTILFQPQATICHKESASVGKTSLLKTYYLNRNRVLFMKKNRTWWQFSMFSLYLFLIALPKNTLFYSLKGEWQHLKTFWRAIWWNYSNNPERFEAENEPIKRLLPTKRTIGNYATVA